MLHLRPDAGFFHDPGCEILGDAPVAEPATEQAAKEQPAEDKAADADKKDDGAVEGEVVDEK